MSAQDAMLMMLNMNRVGIYDAIILESHYDSNIDMMMDLTLAWKLLKLNGILILRTPHQIRLVSLKNVHLNLSESFPERVRSEARTMTQLLRVHVLSCQDIVVTLLFENTCGI